MQDASLVLSMTGGCTQSIPHLRFAKMGHPRVHRVMRIRALGEEWNFIERP